MSTYNNRYTVTDGAEVGADELARRVRLIASHTDDDIVALLWRLASNRETTLTTAAEVARLVGLHIAEPAEYHYLSWFASVDDMCVNRFGVSVYDMPDRDYWGAYNRGLTNTAVVDRIGRGTFNLNDSEVVDR